MLDVAVASTTCIQLSSFVRVSLSVKAMVPERALSIVSRVLTFAVYILEDMRTRSAICSYLFRKVGLGVGFAASSHRFVVFHSV